MSCASAFTFTYEEGFVYLFVKSYFEILDGCVSHGMSYCEICGSFVTHGKSYLDMRDICVTCGKQDMYIF